MFKFKEIISKTISDIDELPLFYTTDIYNFENIIINKNFEFLYKPQIKDSIKHHIYYGKPLIDQVDNHVSKSYLPFSIIFQIDKSFNNYYISPSKFDTLKKHIDNTVFFHENTASSSFTFDHNIDNAKKIVKTFYNNNRNYIKSDLDTSNKYKDVQFEINDYINLLKSFNHVKDVHDAQFIESESLKTIEFINEIHTNKTNPIKIIQFIIPLSYYSFKEFIENLKSITNFEPLSYDESSGNPIQAIQEIKSVYLYNLFPNTI